MPKVRKDTDKRWKCLLLLRSAGRGAVLKQPKDIIAPRLKQLRGYLKHPSFQGVMLDRQTIEAIVVALDPDYRPAVTPLPHDL